MSTFEQLKEAYDLIQKASEIIKNNENLNDVYHQLVSVNSKVIIEASTRLNQSYVSK